MPAVRLEPWIGGRAVAGSGAAFASRDPARPEQVVAEVRGAGAAEVEAALATGVEACERIRALGAGGRAAILHRWAAAVEAGAAELAGILVREVGKPIGEARAEVARVAVILRWFAAEALREDGRMIPAATPDARQWTESRPVGVAGIVTPWNFPLAIPAWKLAPAFAFGNAAVWKPSELAPLAADALARSAFAAGMPPGALAVLFGGREVGRALIADPRVAAVSFTGSVAAGRDVARACAARMARCQAEMGGKNVGIVLPDADLAAAAASVAGGAFRFAGQKCTATSRVVVDRRMRGAFVDALRAAAARLPVGDPADEPTAVGPVIHGEARDRIAAAVEAAGAEILWRGDAPRGPGHWVAPLLLGGVPPAAPLAQQELFGPVLCLFEAAGLDEAIALANGTELGLSASLFTRDLDAALAYVARIDAGMVRVNADTTGVDPHAPFGGLRASGYGAREQGTAAREFYTQQRTVLIQRR